MSARDKIRALFESNVGQVLTTQAIRDEAGISEYARRIRELRDIEGMQIKTHNDRHDLKPGEYVLESLDRIPVIGRLVSPKMRMEILERNGFTCQLCGSGPGDVDPYNPGRKVRLHIDHILPVQQGGTDDRENLRVVCAACNQSKSNVEPPSESALNLIARIRKAPKEVQREVFDVLKKKFS